MTERRLVLTPKFARAFRKFVRQDRRLRSRIEETLREMSADAFAPSLATHRLSGALQGLWASSCGYDCRILFSIETDPDSGNEVILLLNIGTHDEVY